MKNREIKFRAWDTKTKNMLTGFHLFGEMILIGGISSWQKDCGNPSETSLEALNDLIIMQFTGLKDKNGKEIYEGDIIEINNYQYHLIRPVEFYRGAFCVQGYNWNERECEVIGNIYENPDLL